ncbi:MAG: hypothetical protein ACLR1V_06565 [Coprococcus sp.]
MKENETLKINPLPSKTWYWLHLNDTTVKWNGNVQPCMVTTEEPEQVSEAGLNIKEMTTGVGAEAGCDYFQMRIFRFYSLQQRLKLVTESSDWISAVKIRRMQRELFILQRKKMPV